MSPLHQLFEDGPYLHFSGTISAKVCLVDRDGTLNVQNDEGYVFDPDKIELAQINLPLLAALSARMPLVVVSNQGGIAKGLCQPDDVWACHQRLAQLLQPHAIMLAGLIFCPHHPSVAPCECRKPSPRMLTIALQRYDASNLRSLFVGNSASDAQAAEAAHVRYVDVHDANALRVVVTETPATGL